jgi:hypothetical protein
MSEILTHVDAGVTTLTIARRPGDVGFSLTTGIYLASAKLISWPAFRHT